MAKVALKRLPLGNQAQGFMCVLNTKSLSGVRIFVNLGTIVQQAPLSMGFPRQIYWGGLPCPPPGDLPDPGIEPTSLLSPALAGKFFTTSTTWGAQYWYTFVKGRVKMVKGREAWSAAVHGWGHKESDKTERLNNKIVIL